MGGGTHPTKRGHNGLLSWPNVIQIGVLSHFTSSCLPYLLPGFFFCLNETLDCCLTIHYHSHLRRGCEDHRRAGAPLLHRQTVRVGDIQPGEEKASGIP